MGTDLMQSPAQPVNYNNELDGAQALMKSGLLPAGIKSAEAAMFVILTGRDLGLSPVQSLRSIHVIQGKIEVAADMQLGLFHRAGGKSQWVTLTNEQATLKLVAPWLIEPHVESFSLADAKQAKLGGDNWAKYPKAMLRSRAITAGLKSIGFDPTAGIYGAGEISGAEVVVEGEIVEAAAAPKESAPQAAGSPTPTDEPATGATTLTSGGEATDRAESDALAAIEQYLPSLTRKQQEYVREKLRDGADPLPLLAKVSDMVLAARPRTPVAGGGYEGATSPAVEVIDMASKPAAGLFSTPADPYKQD